MTFKRNIKLVTLNIQMYVLETRSPAGDENKARVRSSGKPSPPGGREKRRKKKTENHSGITHNKHLPSS